MSPASYNRWATCIVLATEKYNFREASCCRVDVVKGAEGDFFAGFLSKSPIENLAPIFLVRKASASSLLEKVLPNLAVNTPPFSVLNSAETQNDAF